VKLEAELATAQRFWDMEYLLSASARSATKRRAILLIGSTLTSTASAAHNPRQDRSICLPRAGCASAVRRRATRPCACARTPSTRWNGSICGGAESARVWERRLEALRTQVRAEVGRKAQRFAMTRRMGLILNQPLSG
jgi:hypothetical protein